jgi:hypothetical protein
LEVNAKSVIFAAKREYEKDSIHDGLSAFHSLADSGTEHKSRQSEVHPTGLRPSQAEDCAERQER